VGVIVGERVGEALGELVGVIVGVLVGVLVGPSITLVAATSPLDPPARFQIDRTLEAPFAIESEEIDLGAPELLTNVDEDHDVYGLFALR
jgi:hypothetical protein